MKRIHFQTEINAPASRVWQALWQEENYKAWTAVFCEGSYAESDWNEGSRIRFLTPNGEGMYSTIATKKENEVMAFTHLGIVRDGQEQPIDEAAKAWTGAQENYYLKTENGKTILSVEMDITDDHVGYFEEAFPKGLAKVKELAEAKA